MAEEKKLIAPVHIGASLLAFGAYRGEFVALERLENQFVRCETSRHG